MDIVEEIKARLTIEEVVSQYVELKKTGKNFKGLCPFHKEKTPSFIVSPEKQLAWCFGCQKGGDIFAFVQEIENIDFSEAINVLAERANIDVSKYRQQSGQKVSKSEKDELFHAHDLAANFYRERMFNSADGKKALEYVKDRGVSDEMIEYFQIGWSPDSFQETYQYLLKQGVSREVVLKSGLAIAKDTSGQQIYDRFHGRVMFPVKDSLGRICAFGGRAVKEGQDPKYLNSPETIIYNKRNLLYGYFDAKKEIKERDEAVIVEGYFDVIASFQAGVKNVVATSGTALTSQQLQLIKRMTANVIFSFDTDRAGIEAARRGIEVAEPMEMDIRVAAVKSGKDPADLVRENPDQWKEVVKNAVPYLEFFIRYYKGQIADDDPKRINKILEFVLPLLKTIKSRLKLDEAVRFTAGQLNLNPEFIYDDLRNLKGTSGGFVKSGREYAADLKPLALNDYETLLALIISFPESIKDLCDKLRQIGFSPELQNIYNLFWTYYNPSRLEFDKDNFFAHLSNDDKKTINIITLYIENKYKEFSFDTIQKEVTNFITRIERLKSDLIRQRLHNDLKEAEKSGDFQKVKEVLEQIQRTYLNS